MPAKTKARAEMLSDFRPGALCLSGREPVALIERRMDNGKPHWLAYNYAATPVRMVRVAEEGLRLANADHEALRRAALPAVAVATLPGGEIVPVIEWDTGPAGNDLPPPGPTGEAMGPPDARCPSCGTDGHCECL